MPERFLRGNTANCRALLKLLMLRSHEFETGKSQDIDEAFEELGVLSKGPTSDTHGS